MKLYRSNDKSSNSNSDKIKRLSYISAIVILFFFGIFLLKSACSGQLSYQHIPAVIAVCLTLFAVTIGQKLHAAVKIFLCAGMWTWIASFIVFTAYLLCVSLKPIPEFVENEDNIIVVVYGCKVNGETVSDSLEDRLIKTAEILNKYPSAICICSGGKGKGEKISEAVAMKKYLENCSIKNKIYTEDQSKTTIQNIEYSIQLIDDIGVSENYKIISVSSWYHMARIQYIFNQRGYSTYSAASEVSNVIEMISSVVREYMAYTKMLFTL